MTNYEINFFLVYYILLPISRFELIGIELVQKSHKNTPDTSSRVTRNKSRNTTHNSFVSFVLHVTVLYYHYSRYLVLHIE